MIKSNNISRAEQYKAARKLDLHILSRIIRIVLHYPVRVTIALVTTIMASLFQLFIPRYVGQAVDNAQGLLGVNTAAANEIEVALWFAALMILGLSIMRGLFASIQNNQQHLRLLQQL